MLDIKDIRVNAEAYKNSLSRRSDQYVEVIDCLLSLDVQKRDLQKEVETLQSQRNTLSKSITSKEMADQVREEVKSINTSIDTLAQSIQVVQSQIDQYLWNLPNVPDSTVPDGLSEESNQEISCWGDISSVSENDHLDIALKFGLLDQELTSQVSGSRMSSFISSGARLQRAITNFFLEEAHLSGYMEVSPPAIVNSSALFGTGQLPKFEDDLYKLDNSEQYLIPTAEVPLTGLFVGAVSSEDLPKRLCAYTPCFRREAGSAGRDTRGIIRQHQFDKVELVHLCFAEDSDSEHERLVRHAELLLEKLKLPYRRVLLCAGDMGFSAQKCYDLEVWFPSQAKYREISSCSNCGDFQARRLGLKAKRSSQGKAEYLHTLNGSGLAVGRAWAAILENYQVSENEIKVPDVLQKYFGSEIISVG